MCIYVLLSGAASWQRVGDGAPSGYRDPRSTPSTSHRKHRALSHPYPQTHPHLAHESCSAPWGCSGGARARWLSGKRWPRRYRLAPEAAAGFAARHADVQRLATRRSYCSSRTTAHVDGIAAFPPAAARTARAFEAMCIACARAILHHAGLDENAHQSGGQWLG
jgi:hypothetical protein